jgi:hypothetical protein
MEPEVSVDYAQEIAISPYFELNEFCYFSLESF